MSKTILIILTLTLSIINSGCNSEPRTAGVTDPEASNYESIPSGMSAEDQFNLGHKYPKGSPRLHRVHKVVTHGGGTGTEWGSVYPWILLRQRIRRSPRLHRGGHLVLTC